MLKRSVTSYDSFCYRPSFCPITQYLGTNQGDCKLLQGCTNSK